MNFYDHGESLTDEQLEQRWEDWRDCEDDLDLVVNDHAHILYREAREAFMLAWISDGREAGYNAVRSVLLIHKLDVRR